MSDSRLRPYSRSTADMHEYNVYRNVILCYVFETLLRRPYCIFWLDKIFRVTSQKNPLYWVSRINSLFLVFNAAAVFLWSITAVSMNSVFFKEKKKKIRSHSPVDQKNVKNALKQNHSNLFLTGLNDANGEWFDWIWGIHQLCHILNCLFVSNPKYWQIHNYFK